MSRLRVGLVGETLNARHSPTALVRANYLTAAASRIDSFWVSDHLNALLPRGIAAPQYLGAAQLIPKIDAYLEPWTMPGPTAAPNRLARSRLGVGVTDACRGRFGVVRPPAFRAVGRCPTGGVREPVNEGLYPS
jgi:phthiodiolone/phenolphthiodiolone dimycocerosates ketoreductase